MANFVPGPTRPADKLQILITVVSSQSTAVALESQVKLRFLAPSAAVAKEENT